MRNLVVKIFGIISVAVFSQVSCVALKPGLVGQGGFRENAVEMKVAGRYGWTINKIVKFGEFRTSRFSHGFTTYDNDGPDKDFFGLLKEDNLNARQKFSFKQYDSSGNAIKVMVGAVLNTKTVHYTKNVSSEEVLINQYAIGLVFDGKKYSMVYSEGLPSVVSMGDDSLEVINYNDFDKTAKLVFRGILFKQKGETIAALSLINSGTVWMRNDLDARHKLIIAAISTALLLQPDFKNVKEGSGS